MSKKCKKSEVARSRAVVCWETGEVFESASAAAQAVGLSAPVSIYKAMREHCMAGGYHWYRADQPKPDASELGKGRKRPVICIETGEVFESMSAASAAMGLEPGSVALWLAVQNGGMAAGFHWCYKDEPRSLEEALANEGPSGAVVCWETGEVFESVKEAAQAKGIKSVPNVYSALKSGYSCGGYHWYWEGQPKPRKSQLSKTRKCAVLCVETGEVFESLTQAAGAKGIKNPSQLSRAVRTGAKAGGYHWTFAK